LVHLTPYDFNIDDEGVVSLVCNYDSKGLDKYIPESVMVTYSQSLDLFNELMGMGDEEITPSDLSNLWWFTPFAYIVPCFGSY
jgi:hypothetical protein